MPGLDTVQSSPTLQLYAVSSSEAASLKGHKAQTPIIAGSVCGGLMGVAWIIGFIVYFIKRRKRKERKAMEAAGWTLPKTKKTPEKPAERIIVPPDPAIILGHRRPGEPAFLNDKRSRDHDHSLPTTSSNAEQIPNLAQATTYQQSPHSTPTPMTTVYEVSRSQRHDTADDTAIPRQV